MSEQFSSNALTRTLRLRAAIREHAQGLHRALPSVHSEETKISHLSTVSPHVNQPPAPSNEGRPAGSSVSSLLNSVRDLRMRATTPSNSIPYACAISAPPSVRVPTPQAGIPATSPAGTTSAERERGQPSVLQPASREGNMRSSDEGDRFGTDEARLGLTSLITRILRASKQVKDHETNSSGPYLLELSSSGKNWDEEEKIGDDGVAALAKFLLTSFESVASATPKVALKVMLSYHSITDRGFRILFDALETLLSTKCFVLTTLDISGNDVGQSSLMHLKRILETHAKTTIEALYLRDLPTYKNNYSSGIDSEDDEVIDADNREDYEKGPTTSLSNAWEHLAASALECPKLKAFDSSITQSPLPGSTSDEEPDTDSENEGLSTAPSDKQGSYPTLPHHPNLSDQLARSLAAKCDEVFKRTLASHANVAIHFALFMKAFEALSHSPCLLSTRPLSTVGIGSRTLRRKGTVDLAGLIGKIAQFAGVDASQSQMTLNAMTAGTSSSGKISNPYDAVGRLIHFSTHSGRGSLTFASPIVRCTLVQTDARLQGGGTVSKPLMLSRGKALQDNYAQLLLRDIFRNPQIRNRILAYLSIDEQYRILPRLNFWWCDVLSSAKTSLDLSLYSNESPTTTLVERKMMATTPSQTHGRRPKLVSYVFEKRLPPRSVFVFRSDRQYVKRADQAQSWSGLALRSRMMRSVLRIQRLEFRAGCLTRSESQSESLSGDDVMNFMVEAAKIAIRNGNQSRPLSQKVTSGLLPCLLELNLSGLRYTSNLALDLVSKHCSSLRLLNVSGSRGISDAGLIRVCSECSSLQTLIARDMPNITGRGFATMIKHLTLRSRIMPVRGLDLSGSPLVDDEACRGFLECASRLTHLRALALADTSVSRIRVFEFVVAIYESARSQNLPCELQLLDLRGTAPADALHSPEASHREIELLNRLRQNLPGLRIHLDAPSPVVNRAWTATTDLTDISEAEAELNFKEEDEDHDF